MYIPELQILWLAGCEVDVAINLTLLCLGLVPGYLHAWYLIYVYRENKSLSKPVEGGRPFVFSNRLQEITTLVNRSTASLPPPRTSTEVVQAHRSNPAVQKKLAQEQKQTSTPEPKQTTSARATPVSTPGPSTRPAQKTAQATASRPTPTPSPLPVLDKNDGHSPKTKD
ncbi:hypothetical protein QBC41DRAFT_262414 [Cercophora samala]|uniref:Uncharacterized protein n=1 Tax=Cercophora samala TaxID=330535 RepID=A0AA39YVR7_9PEZI|nr:hypothetical protein QBC41DRAFT_262414 [Cercophora samala]